MDRANSDNGFDFSLSSDAHPLFNSFLIR